METLIESYLVQLEIQQFHQRDPQLLVVNKQMVRVEYIDNSDSYFVILISCCLCLQFDRRARKKRERKLKVQAQIQGDQLRVTAKKIDDLQFVIDKVKNDKSIGVHLDFVNFK